MRKFLVISALSLSLLLPVSASADKTDSYLREVLPNGLTVIVKHNPDSRVFAIDILGKNRAAWEKSDQVGITDFVNRMLVKGTAHKTAEEVQAALDDIGAKLTTNDIPYIPYDDRYTWRAFTFLKFETIDEFARDGIKILYEIVSEPSFPEEEVEKTKNQVMGIIGMKSGSTYQTCGDLYYSKMFENNPLSKPVLGTRRSVAGFTSADLAYHHKIFYNPPNLIMTVVSNENPKQVMKWIKKQFKNLPPYPVDLKNSSIPTAVKKMGVLETMQAMDKEQVYIDLGCIVPGLTSENSTALSLAIEILSSRLQLDLREKQGLAYSVGAGVRYLGDFGWFTCSIGTGYENFEIARDGILAEIEKLKTEPIDQAELDKARNSLWGSMLMRNMSCINQAYNMAYYEYVGVGYDYDDNYRDRLDKVTIADVQAAAKNFLDTHNYVLAYVGRVAADPQSLEDTD
jgi:zinc protease